MSKVKNEQKLVSPYEFTSPNMKGRTVSINGKAHSYDLARWLFCPNVNGVETNLALSLGGYNMNIKNARHIKFLGLTGKEDIRVIVNEYSVDFTIKLDA